LTATPEKSNRPSQNRNRLEDSSRPADLNNCEALNAGSIDFRTLLPEPFGYGQGLLYEI
jgi:hypothetical protein